MALPIKEPLNETPVFAVTTSCATTPVAAITIAPVKGRIVRTFAVSYGTTTGTIAVAIATTSSPSGITSGLVIPAGAGSLSDTDNPTPATAIYVNEGDVITFTPSGGTGATIGATFCAVIRS